MTEPAYRGLEAAEIPRFATSDSKGNVHLVAGQWRGAPGPIRPLVPISLMLLVIEAGGSLVVPVPEDHAILFYMVRGSAGVGGGNVAEHHLAAFGRGEAIRVSSPAGAMILFGHAAPFREPIVAHGPFVMNSAEEIRQAIQDYQSGRLGAL
jgi:redox-sensitive bicupin YhaK (pirin superfamily)